MISKETPAVQPQNISVKELVAFSFPPDSLFPGFTGADKALSGINGHKLIRERRPPHYTAEVPVSYTMQQEGIVLHINGRIDGVFTTHSPVIIEEIKTGTFTPAADEPEMTSEGNPVHRAQAKCYGYMYAEEHTLPEVIIQLTYLLSENGKTVELRKAYTTVQLKQFFLDLVQNYVNWLKLQADWQQVRNRSIAGLTFPYSTYRKGQRSLAVQVFRSVKAKSILFAQAPTGTGKTMAVLFPALKAMEQGLIHKIFYLTARTTGRTAAVKALADMRRSGLRLKHVVLTAKKKICFCPEIFCDAEQCIFAAGYYTKLKNSADEIYHLEEYNREQVEHLAEKFQVCPFELSLDISLTADCIICDYNYVFDPRVRLKRYFMRITAPYLFLIDEAHNLPDRAREMFSARLLKKTILHLKRNIKTGIPALAKKLDSINKIFIQHRKAGEAENRRHTLSHNVPEKLLIEVGNFVQEAGSWLENNIHTPFRTELLEFYFDCRNFLQVAEYFDTNYISYFEQWSKGEQVAKLFCLDPAPLIMKVMRNCAAAIFFSATLVPMNYFKRVLCADPEIDDLILPSPFPRENLLLSIYYNLSTRYIHRAQSYSALADIISSVYTCRPGNYLVYFPSYAYMHEVASVFTDRYADVFTLIQSRNMTEEERANFLSNFTAPGELFNTTAAGTRPVVGFVLMGGIFGEGIDLTGEKLIGVIVAGVGLPQLCLERDLIRQYYSDPGKDGFRYSYQAPGFNKVMQAAGRVIRTERDRGVVVLVDTRFVNSAYRSFFPPEWMGFAGVRNMQELCSCLKKFWK